MSDERKKLNNGELESLRAGIEQDCRFKTAFQGYDKKSVKEYICSISESYEEQMAKLSEECKRLSAENAQLLEKLQQKDKDESEIRMEERSRVSSELDIREGLVAKLRLSNEALEAENHRLALENTDMRQMLGENCSYLQSGNEELSSLSDRLSELLQQKFRETENLVRAWQTEYSESIRCIESKINSVGKLSN